MKFFKIVAAMPNAQRSEEVKEEEEEEEAEEEEEEEEEEAMEELLAWAADLARVAA